MTKIEPIPLKPSLLALQGISPRQIQEHYDILYKGYVNSVNEIRNKLPTVSRADQNPRYTEYRELKVEETFNMDGVTWHEMYFNNLGGRGSRPDESLLNAIQRNFGSYASWEADFRAAAAASRGWAVLSYDKRDGKMHNYLLDAHNVGVVNTAIPILIIDVYEHAYFIDYGAHRAPYIDAFMNNIDWNVVNWRFASLMRYLEIATG